MNKGNEPLPFEDHVEVGRRLKGIRTELVGLRRQVGRHYPASSRVVGQAGRALRALDQLRRELDEQLLRDHPVRATSDVYYGDAREALEQGGDGYAG